MASLFTPPRYTPVDGNGLSMPGAKLEFFASGTTTPLDTYTTSDLTTANTNPVVANADGLFPPIYLQSATLYKVVLKTSADVTVWTTDPVEGAPLDTTPSVGLLRGFLSGLTLSNSATSPDTEIDVSEGACTDDTNTLGIIYAGGTLDCTTTGVDGLDTGTLANSTWYHVFVIDKGDGVNGLLASTSVSSPALPTGYTFKRRIGSFLTDGTADIILFIQDGDHFHWATAAADITAGNPGLTEVLRTVSVPLGVRVQWVGTLGLSNADASISGAGLGDPNGATPLSMLPNVATTANSVATANTPAFTVWTNTSSQINSLVFNFSSGNVSLRIRTLGWIDRRGQDA